MGARRERGSIKFVVQRNLSTPLSLSSSRSFPPTGRRRPEKRREREIDGQKERTRERVRARRRAYARGAEIAQARPPMM